MLKNSKSHIISMVVSKECNIRCTFCYQDTFEPIRIDENILYGKLSEIYPSTSFLALVGGEVTIVPGMKEYIRWLHTHYPNVQVLMGTNGVCFDESWVTISCECSLLINYSLNASNPESYRSLVSNASYRSIYDKIRTHLDAAVLKEKESNKPFINNVSMVITEESINDMVPFVKLLLQKGLNAMIRFDVQNFELTDKIREAEETAYKLAYYCEDYIEVKLWHNPSHQHDDAIMKRIRKEEAGQKREFLQSIPSLPEKHARKPIVTLFDYAQPDAAGNCTLPGRCLAIMIDGSACPCYNLPGYVVGNLNKLTAGELLTNDKMKRLRHRVANGDYRLCFDRCPHNPSS
jgi:MoaA/NifB/PqqE/SkfB family radical SAM enzyme